MAIIRWNQSSEPWSEMKRVQEEMNRLFRSYWGEDARNRSSVGLFPSLNLATDEKTVTLRAEMPGVTLEKIDLSITQDTISIKGEREQTKSGTDISFHRRERRTGYFNRTVSLPFEVDPERARASYKDGVLEVVVDRGEKTKPRQISVKVG